MGKFSGSGMGCLETTIDGIPCVVWFDWFPAMPGTESCPPEPEGFETLVVCDRKGYVAEWLRDKLEREPALLDRLTAEIHDAMEAA